jgi:Flp pilus assembly protein TadG
MRRLVVRLAKDECGSTAVEFGVIGLMFVIVLLAIIQISLVFLSQIVLHDALSDAATGETNAMAHSANRTGLRDAICARLILSDNCADTMKLEMQPVSSSARAITGASFTGGTSGSLTLIRAEAPIITFVPMMPPLKVSGAAVFLQP